MCCECPPALKLRVPSSQEPQLVYSRVSGEAPQLLAAEVATAVGLCGRLVAVGTRRGAVVLYDTQGKLARAASAGREAGHVHGADDGRAAPLMCAACRRTAPRSTTSVLTPPERMSRPLPRTATSRCASAF